MTHPLPVSTLSQLSPAKWESLDALAACGARGTTGMMTGPLIGGALAALVQFGLAERMPPADRLGGLRYRIADRGLEALAHRARVRPAHTSKEKPRGLSSTMAHRDTGADGSGDFFPTPPWGARAGAELIVALDPMAPRSLWWEPACGAMHMAHGLADYAPRLFASDLYRYGRNATYDFLSDAPPPVRAGWIVSNPPFEPAAEFIALALQRADRGVAMLLRVGFLESIGRYDLLSGAQPLSYCATFCERLPMLRGRYDPDKTSAAFYAWFVWLKPAVASPAARLARRARATGGAHLGRLIPPGTRDRLTRDSDRAFAVRGAG